MPQPFSPPPRVPSPTLPQIRAKQLMPCSAPECSKGMMRFKVMMYDDGEGEASHCCCCWGCPAGAARDAATAAVPGTAAAAAQPTLLLLVPFGCRRRRPAHATRTPSVCPPCPCGAAECITPDDVMDLMEEDVKAADLVLWVGISFQQSASTAYFRSVRCWIQVRRGSSSG